MVDYQAPNTLLRLQAQVPGPYTSTSRVTLQIPDDGQSVYDLSNSYLDFEIVPTVGNLPVAGTLYDIALTYGANTTPIWSLAPIKRVLTSCGRLSVVDTRLENNRFMSSLLEFQASRNCKLSNSFKSPYQVTSCYGILGGPFSQLVGLGTNISINRVAHAMIPLQYLTGLASCSAVSVQKTGLIEISCDFEDPTAFTPTLINTLPNAVNCLDFTAGTSPVNLNTILTNQQYLELNSSPFYVGQAIQIGFTNDTSPAATANTYITGLQIMDTLPNAYRMQITFNDPLPAVAPGKSITAITVVGIPPGAGATVTIQFQNAQLLLSRYNRKMSVPKSLSYWSFDMRPITPSSTANPFSFSQQIPAGVLNVWLLFWNPASLVSSAQYLYSWTPQLKGLSRSFPSQQVAFHSSAHFELIARAFANSSFSLSDLSETQPNNSQATAPARYPQNLVGTAATTKIQICAVTLPQDPGVQYVDLQFTISMSGANPCPNMLMFMERPNTIDFEK